MSEDLITLREISVRFGGGRRLLRPPMPMVRAVSDVSLAVQRGEVLGLVGESGSGKTTLGRTILGLQRESGGEIRLGPRVVSGLAPRAARRARKAIQYVHQDAGAALDSWWSVGRSLEEGLIIQGMADRAERRRRIDAMLEAVGLDATATRRYPHEFSGGQLRRLALARVLVLGCEAIILDEPTSGLDMSVQATILNLLADLRQRMALTYIFISHDLSVVRRFCTRVAVMYRGRIVELADAATLFDEPSHAYTRALLAASPSLDPDRQKSSDPAVSELSGAG